MSSLGPISWPASRSWTNARVWARASRTMSASRAAGTRSVTGVSSFAAAMHITLITPANRQSRAGNRTTAARWARLLRALGHRVRVAVTYEDEPADLMIALHAWRSAAAIERFRARHPARPLIVGLGGTDVYHFLATEPATTLRSLDLADALVGLHDLVGDALPPRHRGKL